VAELAAQLAGLPGAVAVVLGGSRAGGTARPSSDWDLGLYYRAGVRPLDPADVRRLGHEGHVSELGEWGPIVHGGAWLTLDGTPVDVLFRDLDRIEHWLDEAGHGRFQVLIQNGYIVGAPTYLPVGELAVCRPLVGEVPRVEFPEALAATAPARWEERAGVSLMFARQHARGGDSVGCVGMLADAILCVAHARMARRRQWVLNEKCLVDRAELGGTQALLADPGRAPADLLATVDAVAGALGAPPGPTVRR
jgi:predicted nucleotidyltransferase